MGFFFISGHACIKDGTTWSMINEFDKKKSYYKLLNMELKAKTWAEIYPFINIVCFFNSSR